MSFTIGIKRNKYARRRMPRVRNGVSDMKAIKIESDGDEKAHAEFEKFQGLIKKANYREAQCCGNCLSNTDWRCGWLGTTVAQFSICDHYLNYREAVKRRGEDD